MKSIINCLRVVLKSAPTTTSPLKAIAQRAMASVAIKASSTQLLKLAHVCQANSTILSDFSRGDRVLSENYEGSIEYLL
jgi:hypothetical protein